MLGFAKKCKPEHLHDAQNRPSVSIGNFPYSHKCAAIIQDVGALNLFVIVQLAIISKLCIAALNSSESSRHNADLRVAAQANPLSHLKTKTSEKKGEK